ncbi:MAG: Fur family transcriptional regulator [Chloroflexota bacterium]
MLRRRGYKLTTQRQAVIRVMALSNAPLTPAELYTRVCRKHPGIGLVSVYRTLEILLTLGLVCEVRGDGKVRGYLMRRPAGHHHHMVCMACGTVTDFNNCDLRELETRLSRQTGFQISRHLLEFQGRCAECQQKLVTKGDTDG